MSTRHENFTAFNIPANRRQRFFLLAAAVVLIVSAAMHAAAFGRVLAAVSRSNLDNFMEQGLKVLWLVDSVVQFVLAFVFACAAFRPQFISRCGIAVLAFIPAVTVALLYFYIGNFIGAHLLLLASLLATVSIARR